jgi:hypothetical protein
LGHPSGRGIAASLLVDVADHEERRAEDRDHVRDQGTRQQLAEYLNMKPKSLPTYAEKFAGGGL